MEATQIIFSVGSTAESGEHRGSNPPSTDWRKDGTQSKHAYEL